MWLFHPPQPQSIKNSRGQTLIEVLVALSIAAVMMGALVVVVINSLKNAQFAQNQTKATKYAQETIDQIRAIRDQDGSVTVQTSNSCSGDIVTFTSLWSYFLSGTTTGVCSPKGSPNSPCQSNPVGVTGNGCFFVLNQSSSIDSLSEPSNANKSNYYQPLDTTFSRLINLSDFADSTSCPGTICDYKTEKQLTVTVQWTDGSGTHQSNLQTILAPRII